jgi:CCR4-NOT transcription complex subunit 2
MFRNNPLYQTFGSPWAEPSPTLLDPEFTLPACYTVTNVNPIKDKVAHFSDETLFYIFYTMPKDVMQEVVATELINRNWRYHKVYKFWLTKDDRSTAKQMGPDSEFGYYIIFDAPSWKRERKEMLLEYSMLDTRNRDAIGA